MRSGNSNRSRRWIFRGCAIGLSLVLALLMAEASVRLFSKGGESLLVKDVVVGQRYEAYYTGSRFNPEAARPVPLRFNALGYRGPDYMEEPSPNTRRVVVLGDSYVAAVQVEEQDTLTAQLEKHLNTVPGERWEVLNFGISGYSTAQSLLTWENYARYYHPDLVVLCFYNGNDLADNHAKLSTAHRPYFSLNGEGELVLKPVSRERARLSRFLARNSRFYVWQRDCMRNLRDSLRSASHQLSPGFQIMNTDPPAVVEDAWAITDKLIGRLADGVAATGAKLLLVSIPAHEQLMPSYWEKLVRTVGEDEARRFSPDYPEKRLREICEARAIDFLPLVGPLRQAVIKAPIHFAATDYCHFNENGHHESATVIFDHLKQTQLAQKK